MYTLKIRWTRHEHDRLADEMMLFVPADEVHVHGLIEVGSDAMNARPGGSFQDHRNVAGSGGRDGGRLIQVNHGTDSTWYLASLAWLLGPDGRTIERVAP